MPPFPPSIKIDHRVMTMSCQHTALGPRHLAIQFGMHYTIEPTLLVFKFFFKRILIKVDRNMFRNPNWHALHHRASTSILSRSQHFLACQTTTLFIIFMVIYQKI